MKKFIADINVNNKIINKEVDSKDLQEAEKYFDNFLKYWSKVWFGWKGAFIINVYEKKDYISSQYKSSIKFNEILKQSFYKEVGMAKKKAFNEYEIRGETTAIFLKKRNGQVFETLIDTNYLERVKGLNLHWHVTFAPNTGTYYVKAMQRYTGEDGKRKGRSMYLHIEIMNPKHYPSIYIDHFDHDTLNNLKSNLRISINEDNVKNRKGKNSNNTTGYRNVSYIKAESKYVVQIQIDGKNTQLRWFDDVDEAGEYAEKMREKYYGNFAGAS